MVMPNAPEIDNTLKRFQSLPDRLFLDTSVLQTLQDYGGFIWENELPADGDPIWRIPTGFENLDALRAVMLINERASFQLALSANSLLEVRDRGDPGYLRWAYDPVVFTVLVARPPRHARGAPSPAGDASKMSRRSTPLPAAGLRQAALVGSSVGHGVG